MRNLIEVVIEILKMTGITIINFFKEEYVITIIIGTIVIGFIIYKLVQAFK